MLVPEYSQLPEGHCTKSQVNNCVRRRKNAFLIRVGVGIVWDNVDSMDGCILGRVSGIPADVFAGADDITKEREPGIACALHEYRLKFKNLKS